MTWDLFCPVGASTWIYFYKVFGVWFGGLSTLWGLVWIHRVYIVTPKQKRNLALFWKQNLFFLCFWRVQYRLVVSFVCFQAYLAALAALAWWSQLTNSFCSDRQEYTYVTPLHRVVLHHIDIKWWWMMYTAWFLYVNDCEYLYIWLYMYTVWFDRYSIIELSFRFTWDDFTGDNVAGDFELRLVDGCWWMLMDVDGCWWMLMDVDGCWWMLMDVDGTVYACLVLYIVYSIILYVHSYIVT